MHTTKYKKEKKHISKKDKKLIKLISNPDSDEDSEHELSYYLKDRVKMMKEVLKIIKPKENKKYGSKLYESKNMDHEEINSMLLEELLGISNKRLKCIFNGQTLDEDSSTTDEDDPKPIDVISLDDISDDDFVIDLDSDNGKEKQPKKHKIKVKEEPKRKKLKKENQDKINNTNTELEDGVMDETSEKNLMSVLELLELQARARAIRSQLALENSRKTEEKKKQKATDVNASDNDDAVIVDSPKNTEIIISSSDSDNEYCNFNNKKDDTEENTHQIIDNTEIVDITTKYKDLDNCNDIENPQKGETITQNTNTQEITEYSVDKTDSQDSCEEKNESLKKHTNSKLGNYEKSMIDNNETVNKEFTESDITDVNLKIIDIPLPDREASRVQSQSEVAENDVIVEITDGRMDKKMYKGKMHSRVFNNESDASASTNAAPLQSPKPKRKMCRHKHRRSLSNQDKESSDTSHLANKTILKESESVEIKKETLTNIRTEKKICKHKRNKLNLNKNKSVSEINIIARKNELGERNNSADDGDGIILNVEQSEIDCINLD